MDSLFPPRAWDSADEIVIVGGGFAGLLCALWLSPRPVTVITAGQAGKSAVSRLRDLPPLLDGGADDRFVAETLAAGAGLANERLLRGIVREFSARRQQLAALGVVNQAPATGIALMENLLDAVRRTASVRLMEGFIVEQLRTEAPYVTGLVARDREGGLSDRLLVPTRAVVLACGGIGHLYDADANDEARGDGLAIAARAGALIADAEFVHFGNEAAPGHVGGVHADGSGRTTLEGLWACGEVACTGIEGAGQSSAAVGVVETVVMAARVAEDIHLQLPRHKIGRWTPPGGSGGVMPADDDDPTLPRLQSAMRLHVGETRNREGLVAALMEIERLIPEARSPRARNALVAGKLIAAAAFLREESRGVHQRRDFPSSSEAYARRSFLDLAAADAAARTARGGSRA